MSNRTLPPIGWFRAFESAARLLSFTAASEELGLTQSAVSQQIRSLESRFGCALFVRKHRGIALTDEGRRLLPQVSEGIANLKAAASTFEPAADPELLTIATSVSIAQWFLVPRLDAFMKQHKKIRIRIVTTLWPDEFVASTADVQIRFGPVDSASSSSKPLGTNRLALISSPMLIKPKTNAGSTHTLKAVSKYPLIQAVGTSDTWQRFSEQVGEHSDKQPNLFVDSHGLSVDFAKSGYGMALASTLISSPCVNEGSLVQVHPVTIPARDGYFIETLNNEHEAAAKKFTSWIQKETERMETEAFPST